MEELFWDHSFKLKIYSKEIFMIYAAYKQANEHLYELCKKRWKQLNNTSIKINIYEYNQVKDLFLNQCEVSTIQLFHEKTESFILLFYEWHFGDNTCAVTAAEIYQ